MKRSNLILAIVCAIIDVIAIILGLIVAYWWRADGAELYFWSFSRYLNLAIWTLPLWLVFFSLQRLYSPRNLPRGWTAFGKSLISLFSGWGAILIGLYLWRAPEALVLPRLLILYGILLTSAFVLLGKIIISIIIRILYSKKVGLIKSVIIDGETGDRFIEILKSSTRHGREVVGVLAPASALTGLDSLLEKNRFDEVILAKSFIDDKAFFELLSWAEDHNVSLAVVPSALSVRATNVEVGTVAMTPIMFFLRTPLEGWGRVAKRLMDLVIVLVALIISSPIMLIEYLLVKLTSPGPAIFRQARVGQDGQEFFVHKFRSMYVDADQRFKEFGAWSTDEAKDPRITPVGRVIRKTMIDELPQLWDVFVGKMSIVGPRPEQPKYVDKFVKEVPSYFKRHFVKSGLTGWAQVNGLRGDTSVAERVKYDLYYIENWSIWFDLRIMLATVGYVLRGGK